MVYKQLSLSIFFISIISLVGCGGGGSGDSSGDHITPQVSNPNEIPTVTSSSAVTYTTSIEQNLSIFNEKNTGSTYQLSPTTAVTKSVIEPSYSVRSYDGVGISFLYKFDADKILIVDYDRLANKVVHARLDTTDSTLSCKKDKWSPLGCNGIDVIYDDRTGDSTISFNKQQFENYYYQANPTSSSGSEKVEYKVMVDGTVKGSITSKPLAFSDFEKTHTGEITVNGKKLDIYRAFMRDKQLFIQFKNGESLYLLTGKSSGLISGYDTAEGSFSTSAVGTLKTLANDRVNVKLDNIYFSSSTGSKLVSGDITLIDSSAKVDMQNIGKIDTNYVYAYELSNKEMTYFITSTTGSGRIVIQGQSPVSIDINGYSCSLNNCKNVAISKDGTYIKLNGTLLSGVSVTGSIRTNIH
ncbi:hypothetical protein [Acinetobacter sp. IK40]|jgi:hypothetical protein|uniref:hypothetical protein n=1 Tax=Acinetobacter sp. IK40 TaxID=2928897 RepID=UPI002D1E6123|nr:hypothetical protein [Acinetobacter sp. IK40]MEB3791241.1 hypothetical protein [Acinetobacter sp. IK40]